MEKVKRDVSRSQVGTAPDQTHMTVTYILLNTCKRHAKSSYVMDYLKVLTEIESSKELTG